MYQVGRNTYLVGEGRKRPQNQTKRVPEMHVTNPNERDERKRTRTRKIFGKRRTRQEYQCLIRLRDR